MAAALVKEGAPAEEAEVLAPALETLLSGGEISGNQAGSIAHSEAALSLLEQATGVHIDTDAPLGEVKATIKGLASRQQAAEEAPAAVDALGETLPAETQQEPQDLFELPEQLGDAPEMLRGRAAVEDFAQSVDKAGATVLTSMYADGQDEENYVSGMMKAYSAGRKGEAPLPPAVFQDLYGINESQAQAAYLAGQADGGISTLAEDPHTDYTEDSKGGLGALAARLDGYDEAVQDGVRWSIERRNGSFFVRAARADGTGGYVEDARATFYQEGPFDTREEAVADILAVARNNFYKEDIGNGAGAVEEVSDVPGVRGAGAGRTDAGGLLDRVPPEDVRGDAQEGNAGADDPGLRGETVRLAHGHAESRDDGVRGDRVHQGGSVQSAPGEVSTLTEAESAALLAYKSGGSYQLNAKLREGMELSELEQQIVDGLDTALPKLPAHKGTLYRNIGFDGFGDQEARDAFVAQHSEGALVTYPSYTSTSTAEDGYPVEGDYVVHMVIEGETGRNLAGYGNNSESEVLFERKKSFEVSKLTYDENGTPTIYMTEVIENAEIDQSGESRRGSSGGRVPRRAGERNSPGGSQPDLQPVREAGTGSEVQRASDGNSESDPVQGAGLQEVPAEVTEEPATTEAQIEQKAELGNQEAPKGENFVIPAKGGVKVPTTPKARFKANTDAIKTLRTIMAEGRMATPKEQETLAKYTGWGGLTNAFNEKDADWAKEYKQLKKLLDEGQYKAAKSSILDAYYTDPAVIQGMYHGLAKLGFHGGRLLEPSAGVGRFLGAMPQEMRSGVQSWTAVELDKITGNIAKFLYPNADVRVQGYETTLIPDDYMDLVIGNVPFGNFGVADKTYPAAVTKSIHNYFIAKSLDKLRPGGVACLITSSGTLDATGKEARAYFMKQADLIGAVRLPNTAFEGTGTNVVSDILIFKKRESGTPYRGEAFLDSDMHYLNGGSWNTGDPYAPMNEYFVQHPEMVLGKAKSTGGRYGSGVTYDPLESRLSLQKQIEQAIGKIPARMDYPVRQTQAEVRAEIKKAAAKGKLGGIISKDGKLYKNRDGSLTEDTGVPAADTQRMVDMIAVRDQARKLLDLQLDKDFRRHRRRPGAAEHAV